jgi:hypothetical protein
MSCHAYLVEGTKRVTCCVCSCLLNALPTSTLHPQVVGAAQGVAATDAGLQKMLQKIEEDTRLRCVCLFGCVCV